MKQVTIETVKARIAELEGADRIIGLGLHAEFELACLRQLVATMEQKPFMYGIADPDGNPHMDEMCVSPTRSSVEDAVSCLNEDNTDVGEALYQVVPLYLHPVSQSPDKYNIGEATMCRIFTPTGMTNVSDMQAVFDRVEVVLAGMEQPAPVVFPVIPDYVFHAVATRWPLTADQIKRLYQELQPAVPANSRAGVRADHAEWSQATFGNVGPIGPLKHLAKEAMEAAAAPGDLSEWADMQFLLWDAQRRAGITDEQITQAMIDKLAVNKARQWPEPKDGEPRLHIRPDNDNTAQPVRMSPKKYHAGFCLKHSDTALIAHPYIMLTSSPPKPKMYCPKCEPGVALWNNPSAAILNGGKS